MRRKSMNWQPCWILGRWEMNQNGQNVFFFLKEGDGGEGERWKGRERGRRQGESASGLSYGIGWLDLH